MNCYKARQMMFDHHSGELKPEETAQLEHHLAGCPSCQAEEAELREIISLTGEAVSELPDSELNDAESSAVLERMCEAWNQPPVKKQRKISAWRRVVEYSVAAMIVIILAGMLLPALNSAREKSRRISASGKLDQIGLGIRQDDDITRSPMQPPESRERNNQNNPSSMPDVSNNLGSDETADMPVAFARGAGTMPAPAAAPKPQSLDYDGIPEAAMSAPTLEPDRERGSQTVGGATFARSYSSSSSRRAKLKQVLDNKEDELITTPLPDKAVGKRRVAKREAANKKPIDVYGNVLFQDGYVQSKMSPEAAGELKGIMADEFRGYAKFRRLPKNSKDLFLLPTNWKPVSTFSLDTDTASYTLARRNILDGDKPNPKKVREEEFVNYFDYHYLKPKGEERFAVYLDAAPSPFRSENTLLRIAVQGRDLGPDTATANAWTLLVDASGSMAKDDRMRLTREALELLLKRFKPNDRVSLVLAANENTLVINNVLYQASEKQLQLAIVGIEPDGVCDFRAAVKLAYDTALKNYQPDSGNRVVIFTDGIVKEGTGKADPILMDIAEARKRGITNTVIGVGGDGNDELLETIANKGDGSYVFIDSTAEAEKVFKRDFAARFRVLARDFKIQVVFNPSVIPAYRQIGYRNRQLTAKQFRDDKVDAGEVGSGQSATALYELKVSKKALDEEIGAKVYIRYKTSHNIAAEERVFTITAGELRAENPLSPGFLLAACAAEFAEYLAFPGEPGKATPSRIREIIAPSANLYDPKITTFLRLLNTCK